VPAVLLAAIAALLGAHATAPARLTWDAPDSCPDEVHARSTIERLLGGATPVEGPGAPLSAHVRIEADGPPFVAHVRLGEAGERKIEAVSCAQVADAALLIVAMAIDPRVGITAMPEAPIAADPPPEPASGRAPTPDAVTIEPTVVEHWVPTTGKEVGSGTVTIEVTPDPDTGPRATVTFDGVALRRNDNDVFDVEIVIEHLEITDVSVGWLPG
jgi:hypothetical protein